MPRIEVKVLDHKPTWRERYWWRFRRRIRTRIITLNIIVWMFVLVSNVQQYETLIFTTLGIFLGIFFVQDLKNLIITIKISKEIKRMYEEYLKEEKEKGE